MAALLVLLLASQAQPEKAGAPAARAFPHRSEELEVVRTETGFTVPKGAFELDAVLSILSFEDFRGNKGLDLDVTAFTAEAAFGLVDGLQLEVELPFLRVDPDPGSSESGLGDVLVEGKASFLKGASPLGFVPVDLAGGIRVAIPTGDEDEGLGREKVAFGLFAAVSYPFTAWIAGHGEFWTEWQDGERPIHGLSVAFEFTPWMKEFSLLAALNYSRVGTEKSAVSFVPGAEFRFGKDKPGMSVGLGIPIGLTDRAEEIGVIADFQIRF